MKAKTTYSITAFNHHSKMQEVIYWGLSKIRAEQIANTMKRLGAKKVKLIKE